jgi:hypothetical protein
MKALAELIASTATKPVFVQVKHWRIGAPPSRHDKRYGCHLRRKPTACNLDAY